MNDLSNAAIGSRAIAPAAGGRTRPMYWSVRRELWENRSISLAPIVVAAFVLSGVLISMITLPRRIAAILALDPVKQSEALTMPYSALACALIVTGFLVGTFYCLDALQVSAAIGVSCSGNRCRYPISRPCSRRRAFRS